MSQPAPRWQPRWLAVIWAAGAALQAYGILFSIAGHVHLHSRLIAIGISLVVAAALSGLADRFRVWMVHGTVLVSLCWGFIGLAGVDSPVERSLALIGLLWIVVFIGASFRPGVARAYMVLIGAGIAGGMILSGIAGGIAVGLAFGGTVIVITEILSRTSSQLRREATTDSLTGLLNRNGLEQEAARVRSFDRNRSVAVLLVDLDGFKQVNDREGHRAGDQLLKDFADAWIREARAGDLIARIGGDEFVMLFPASNEDSARATVQRLRRISPVPWSGGLVTAEPGETLADSLDRADRLLYAEKAAKRRDPETSARVPGAT